jgi:lipoate-protein ligase A
MCDRYSETSQLLVDVLSDLGADVIRGEPADAYCPGSHSVSGVDGGEPHGKIAGLAQRVQSGAALVSGCLTVAEADVSELRAVLGPVYRALNVPFDPASVGSVSTAGGTDDPAVVGQALEDALIGSRTPVTTDVDSI